MWRVLERKGERLYLCDGSGESKWVRNEDIEKVMNFESFRQYFMSLDMWCPNLL